MATAKPEFNAVRVSRDTVKPSGFAAAIASSAAAICFLFIAFYFVRLWARLMSLFCAGVPAFRIC